MPTVETANQADTRSTKGPRRGRGRRRILGLGLALAAAPAAPAQTEHEVPADWTLKPDGVAVGGKFRLLFKSTTTRDGTSTDIADYNTHVQTAAAAGHADIQAYSADFTAIGSTEDVNARTNTLTRSTDRDAATYDIVDNDSPPGVSIGEPTGQVTVTVASDNPDALWCATLTVGGTVNGNHEGYCEAAGNTHCGYGSVDDDDFELDGATFTVQSLRWGGSANLHLVLDPAFPSTELPSLTLHAGGDSFRLNDAARGNDEGPEEHHYRWRAPQALLGLNYDDTLTVAIDASPSSLSLDVADLSPEFSATQTDYAAEVRFDVSLATV